MIIMMTYARQQNTNKNILSKNCQRQLLIEYLHRYGYCIPDERILDVIDVDTMDNLMNDIKNYKIALVV